MRPTSLIATLTRAALLLALTLPALTRPAPAQTPNAHIPTDATALGQRIVLPDTWLFSPTDTPANASPTLDDSTWTSISTTQPLTAYGFHNYPYVWYRTHIHLRPETRNIAVETQLLMGRYEVFANGVRVGSFGNMADHSMIKKFELLSFPIPDRALAGTNGSLVLAIRFSVFVVGDAGRGKSTPLASPGSVALSPQQSVPSDAALAFSRQYGVSLIIEGLNAIVGIVALVLFLAIRSQREYFPLSIFLLQPIVLFAMYVCVSHFGTAPFGLDTWMVYILDGVATFGLIEFIRLVLAMPRTRFFIIMEYSALLAPAMGPLSYAGFFPLYLGFVFFFIPRLANLLVLPALLIRHWNRNVDARLLLPAILLTGVNLYFSFFWWAGYLLHITHGTLPALRLHMGVYTLSLSQFDDILFAGGMLFFILLRTIRISRSRANLTAEIAAAATVQQLLLARSSQATPGFLVDSVFLPASSLGGDFFLVTTHPFDGSLIAVIGDVSGKGLTAALRVAMILGCLRRETSHHPGDILAYLNDAILAQGELGFTTALCIRLFLNGDFILANAGHIPPYIANSQSTTADALSREFPTPPALPLGIAPGEVYHLEKGRLAPHERLVLMSDGVPEARSTSGQLYGFDRLPHLTLLPAQAIASAAQTFGQEDDITVLTLTLAP